jgi:tetratricopeptide (TPR) repeat protein
LAFDRDNTLKKAEKLLRQGRLDAAIAEYVKLIEDQPRDWNTANTLGDLYARAGQTDDAVAQYSRIADHFAADGFYPKASALYKKILKLHRDHEPTQLQLAEVSVMQGLLADAKAQYAAIAARRRVRSDRRGEAEMIVRIGSIDPADIDARVTAARTLEAIGDSDAAAERYRRLHADLLEKDRGAEAMSMLREFARLRPDDAEARAALGRAALDAGDLSGAREFLDAQATAGDPQLRLGLLEVHLREGNIEAARVLIPELLNGDNVVRERVLALAGERLQSDPAGAYACIEAVVDCAVAHADFQLAASDLKEFIARVPGHIDGLLKLVEVCVDGGFESEMYATQEQLTDAYLEAGMAAEARVIADDLVAREPWEAKHIERFRRALVMLRVSDPDAEIAERLSGQSPFMATDPFTDLAEPEPAAVAEASPAAETSPADPEPAPAPAPIRIKKEQPGAAEEIDLTGALGLDSSPAPTAARAKAEPLGDGFDRMPGDPQSHADYSEQHMTLARTYLEMGMTLEAITALKAAARSPKLRFEAASTLGRLLHKHGDTAGAVEWLERASEAPAPNPAEARELQYEFGVTLDDSGETARALAIFLELQTEAGDYRDVPSRIDRLARVQSGG